MDFFCILKKFTIAQSTITESMEYKLNGKICKTFRTSKRYEIIPAPNTFENKYPRSEKFSKSLKVSGVNIIPTTKNASHHLMISRNSSALNIFI